MDGGWAVLVTPTIAAPEEASAFVAARLAEGSDFIKIIYDNAHASFGLNLPTLKEDTIAALVSAAHAQHRLAVAHIGTEQQAAGAIDAGIDGLAHLFVMIATATDRKTVDFGSEVGAASPTALRSIAELSGRVLLAALFLIAGIGKIGSYAATAGYMAAVGVPTALLPVVIATEVLGGIAIAVGWKTRIAAFLLAGFTLLSALIFHSNLADQVQFVMFLKNVSIAGGFLLLVAIGAGRFSLDKRAK